MTGPGEAGGEDVRQDAGGLPGLSVRRPLLAAVMNLLIVIAGVVGGKNESTRRRDATQSRPPRHDAQGRCQ